jgi:hypothetical protein
VVALPARRTSRDDRAVRGSRHRAVAAVIVAACLVTPPAAAYAVERPSGRPIVARGTCSESSRWRLGVIRVEGALRIALTLRTRRPGRRWNVFIEHDRSGIFAGARRTDFRGRVRVRRAVPNHVGADRFRFGANNTITGETCRGRLRV